VVISILLVPMRRLLRRADTTARRSAGDARAEPEAAAQIKSRNGLDGYRAKPERENDGKNVEEHKKYCDRGTVEMALAMYLALTAVGLQWRHGVDTQPCHRRGIKSGVNDILLADLAG